MHFACGNINSFTYLRFFKGVRVRIDKNLTK